MPPWAAHSKHMFFLCLFRKGGFSTLSKGILRANTTFLIINGKYGIFFLSSCPWIPFLNLRKSAYYCHASILASVCQSNYWELDNSNSLVWSRWILYHDDRLSLP